MFKQWRHLSNEAENGRIYRNLEKIYFSKSIHQICLCDTSWRPSWPLSIFKIYIADFECVFFFNSFKNTSMNIFYCQTTDPNSLILCMNVPHVVLIKHNLYKYFYFHPVHMYEVSVKVPGLLVLLLARVMPTDYQTFILSFVRWLPKVIQMDYQK